MSVWDELCDLHKGKTGLVIGNGPSLNDIPNSFLKKYISFGSNRIYLRKGLTPTYYTAINAKVVLQFADEINKRQKSETKFIRGELAALIPGSIPLVSLKPVEFSTTPGAGMYEGWTVTFVNLQLAFWMGFAKVLLVGIDHNFSYPDGPAKHSTLKGDDPNHFDPAYFKGAEWDHPNLTRSEEAYCLAQRAYLKDHRIIINCTTRTKLTVFPMASWRTYA